MKKPVLPTDYTSDEGPYIVSKPMTDDEINIKIAKLCGWRDATWRGDTEKIWELSGSAFTPNRTTDKLPKYTMSLDAMHEAEKMIPLSKIEKYWDELEKICRHRYFTEANIKVGPTCCISATAIQRAKAFLITFDLLK